MVTTNAEEAAIVLALLAVSIVIGVMVAVVCTYAFRRGRQLRRWNTRIRRNIPPPGSPLRKQPGVRPDRSPRWPAAPMSW
jgi:ABC-type arginine/histidine transport system permease subunit